MSTGHIDAHHHLWVRAEHPQVWMDTNTMGAIDDDFDEQTFEATAAAAGVTGSVVVQTVHDATETPHLLARAERSALIRGVVGWADVTAPDLLDTLSAWRESPGGHRLVGLRHLVTDESDLRWLMRDDVVNALVALGRSGFTFDLLVKEEHLPAAIAAAGAAPETRFVLDHLAKPRLRTGDLAEWARSMAELARCDNVTAKVSGLVTEADWTSWRPTDLWPAVETALETFGPDRLMFGTDWPVCLLASTYADVVQATEQLLASLSADERDAIFRRNASSFYGLR